MNSIQSSLKTSLNAYITSSKPSAWREPPTLSIVLTLALISYGVFLATFFLLGGSFWSRVWDFGDNLAYIRLAAAIRHWQLSGIVVKQFWGLPYIVAAVSLVTTLSEMVSLVMVCVLASLVTVTLCYWLWDGWIAIFFALLSFDWFQRSLLGGAEPLFLALLLGSFLALRRDRWLLASVLGALATVVRPFGVFALIGLGIELLYRRRVRDAAVATGVAVAIGALYAWPVKHYLGNPFGNVALYQQNDWHGHLPFSFPLLAVIKDTFPRNAPWTNLALTWCWILFVLIALIVAIRSGELRQYAREHTAEAWFVILYALALYTYSAPGWSRSNFPRFALPLLPWALVFFRRYLPLDRRFVWGLLVVGPALAAASTIGIRQAATVLFKHF
jgi:hypothetical protein